MRDKKKKRNEKKNSHMTGSDELEEEVVPASKPTRRDANVRPGRQSEA
jgi:hypothetical protein